MRKPNPLNTLIDLSKDKLDDAGKELAKVNKDRVHTQSQLDTLANYRDDYVKKLNTNTKKGISAANYKNFRQFIGNLDEAIGLQKQVIVKIDKNLELKKQNWLKRKKELNSFNTLKSRQDKKEELRQMRQEQRTSDELSANMYRRRQQSF